MRCHSVSVFSLMNEVAGVDNIGLLDSFMVGLKYIEALYLNHSFISLFI